MLRLLPLILLIGYGWLSWHLSARRTAQMLDRQSRRLDDGPLRDSLDRLANALNIPHIAAFVFETDVWNGLAAPDGRIFITRGFLQARDRGLVSNAELTSVLAHELGHVALGHARRRMIDFTGQNAVMVLLGGLAARFLPGVGPLLINLAGRMLAAHLSKRDEFEADAFATALMETAGFGRGPQISLLEKLGQRHDGQRPPAWLASHPETAARIAAIRAIGVTGRR